MDDSEIVDDGEVALVVVELDGGGGGGDFFFSSSKLYAAAPPPLVKQADIFLGLMKKKDMAFSRENQTANSRFEDSMRLYSV